MNDLAMPNPPTGDVSANEIKRWALDTSDWLWGTMQGAYNEKQTTSQIIVDAVVGMIPVIGDATAARDLLAVSTRLASDPKKREETMEWVLLVVLLFALIPVVGGAIKGVGRLLISSGRVAADAAPLLNDMVKVLNRIGHGDALIWLRQLDLLKHERTLITQFGALCDQIVDALKAIRDQLGWFVPGTMKGLIETWIERFSQLKPLGKKMIPKALQELHARLKVVQKAVYQGEWHTVTPGTPARLYEAEARLFEDFYKARGLHGKPGKYPQNISILEDKEAIAKVYQPREGFPALEGDARKISSDRNELYSPAISSFSGVIKARVVKGPFVMSRVIGIGELNGVKGNYPVGGFWIEGGSVPKTAEEFRQTHALLDEFNHDSYSVSAHIPNKMELKMWEGAASEQWSKNGKQFLEGGGTQLVVDIGIGNVEGALVKQAFESGATSYTLSNGIVLKLHETGWKNANGTVGYARSSEQVKAQAVALEEAEYASKYGRSAGAATATRIEHAGEKENQ